MERLNEVTEGKPREEREKGERDSNENRRERDTSTYGGRGESAGDRCI